jgi:hypothetical protein
MVPARGPKGTVAALRKRDRHATVLVWHALRPRHTLSSGRVIKLFQPSKGRSLDTLALVLVLIALRDLIDAIDRRR